MSLVSHHCVFRTRRQKQRAPKRILGRTSKFEIFASMDSFAAPVVSVP